MNKTLEAAEMAEVATHYVDAAQLAQRALAEARLEDMAAIVAQSHKILGDIAAHQGQPQPAREHYSAAIHACQRLAAEHDKAHGEAGVALAIEGYATVALAELCVRFGDTKQAISLLEQAHKVATRAADSGLEAWVDAAQAGLVAQRGDPKQALALFERSIVQLEENSDLRRASEIRARYATLLVQAGQPAVARAEYERTIAQQEGVGDVRGVADTGGTGGISCPARRPGRGPSTL